MIQYPIQLACITSIRDTPMLSSRGDIDLAFAHLCLEESAYGSYFREAAQSGRTVILDNGIMELGHTVDNRALVEAIRLVRPTFVTPPEILGNGSETLALTRDFIKRFKTLGLPTDTLLLGVVHGRDWEDWFTHYRIFHDELNEVARIGIPYDLKFDVPGVDSCMCNGQWEWMLRNRIQAVALLDRKGYNRKPAHLLGTIDAIELRSQARFPWIVSNDSSTAFVSALHNIHYDLNYGIKADKKLIDMKSHLPAERLNLYNENVRIIREFASREQYARRSH